MQSVIGERETQKALMLGTLYPSSEAARIGLVDELADNVDSMRSRFPIFSVCFSINSKSGRSYGAVSCTDRKRACRNEGVFEPSTDCICSKSR